jgi:uncharacterized protein (TIGR02145 family)
MHASLTIVGHYLLDFPDNLGAREPWSGDLDDMQIWSFALSESEVLDYMNCPPSPGTDGVIAHWDFDEGQGDSVIDLSGNGFHGTLINGTAWSEELPPMVCAQQCSSSDSVLVELFDYPCLCGDGTVWDETSGECVSVISSQNACGEGTEWDNQTETCIIVNPSDTNFDGCVSMTDLLDLLSVFGTCNEIPWSCGDLLEYQGYDYETVQIGEQCWFAENLRSENYSTGDEITSNLSQNDWAGTIHGASCVYGEEGSPCENFSPTIEGCNPEESLEFYGRLYNWFAVTDGRGLCPTGWHSPDDNEWQGLSAHLGGSATAGVNMKSTSGWREGGNGDNSSGFNGYPGGDRYAVDGKFYSSGNTGFWWSSTFLGNPQEPGAGASFYYLEFGNGELKTLGYPPNNGMSVRCIEDSE